MTPGLKPDLMSGSPSPNPIRSFALSSPSIGNCPIRWLTRSKQNPVPARNETGQSALAVSIASPTGAQSPTRLRAGLITNVIKRHEPLAVGGSKGRSPAQRSEVWGAKRPKGKQLCCAQRSEVWGAKRPKGKQLCCAQRSEVCGAKRPEHQQQKCSLQVERPWMVQRTQSKGALRDLILLNTGSPYEPTPARTNRKRFGLPPLL